MNVAPETLQVEFWPRVDRSAGPDGCWPWLGHINPNGYGVYSKANLNYLARRIAFELHHGEELGNRQIRRRPECKKRACVNPAHFRIGPGTGRRKDGQRNLGLHEARWCSKSGVRGVYFDGTRWRAQIGHQGTKILIGRYHTLEEAEAAVRAKREELLGASS